MDLESSKLREFLVGIQLEQFYDDIYKNLRVTRVDHFEHVLESDLLSINMSMPEIRRLFGTLKRKNKLLYRLRKSFRSTHTSESVLEDGVLKKDKHGLKCLVREKDLIFKEVLGNGAFGYVQKAEWTKSGSKEKVLVAVKCFQENGSISFPGLKNELIEEANVMSGLNHPNLLRLYGVVLSSPVMLVSEFAPLGSLLKRLRNEPEKFLISTLCSIVIQITAGMKYLEANRLIHRDLAARNILLMSYEKIKIGDFGLARPLQTNMNYYVMQADGLVPYAWCAPECLKHRKFSHASDVWAFGITVFELFSYGKEPWAGLKGAEILEKIDESNFETLSCPEHCPSSLYSVIRHLCWNHLPEERANFAMLEKCLLNVLPQEVRAVNDRSTDNDDDELLFNKGDIVTVYDVSEDFVWKGQNRSTLQVGYFPSEFVDFARGTISDVLTKSSQSVNYDGKRTSTSLDMAQRSLFLNSIYETEDVDDDDKNILKISPHCQQLKRNSAPESICSGYSSTGEKGGRSSSTYSYCEECTSMSYDSGCYCRSSVYSTDSSKRNSEASVQSIHSKHHESQPISIPGGKSSMINHHHLHDNSAIYQMFPYDSHALNPSTPKSVGSDTTSEKIYDNIRSISLSENINDDSRSSLPDVVNPVKKTKILHRRRSLPRMKSRHSSLSYENKLFSVHGKKERSVTLETSSPKNHTDKTLYTAGSTSELTLYGNTVRDNISTSEQCLYENTVKNYKIFTSEQSLYGNTVKNYKTFTSEQSLYDEVPSAVYEVISKALPSDQANQPTQPIVPPRNKRKEKKRLSESFENYENVTKIKQCVILQSI